MSVSRWWWGVAVALAVAVLAAVAERRRGRRKDLDRIGTLDWRGLQMFALIAAALLAMLAIRS